MCCPKRGRCLNRLRDHGQLVSGRHGSIVRRRNDIETPWRLGAALEFFGMFNGVWMRTAYYSVGRTGISGSKRKQDIPLIFDGVGAVLGLMLGLVLVGCGEWRVNGLAKEPNGCHLLEVFVWSLLFRCCLFALLNVARA